MIRRFLRTSTRYRPRPRLGTPKTERCLDVVITGAPNAGKSMLLNALINARVAAASKKKHTTRGEILGVFNHKNIQLAFHDTPGYVRAADTKRKDIKTLNDVASGAVAKADVDVCMIVVDAAKSMRNRDKDAFAELVQLAINQSKEIVLVLNKVHQHQHQHQPEPGP